MLILYVENSDVVMLDSACLRFDCGVGVTFVLNEWRTKYRRLLNEKDNERTATSTDSISNFETVS